ncbi:MAG: ABC transporter ATP-binding protein [Bacteroidales bacterium]|nr:ABC transporter ATP-binding protein [Bacteroidales bacterium]
MAESPQNIQIKITRLTRTYQKGPVEVRALQEVSCEMDQGKFYSIVGKSGSGKSTLLNLVGGLDKPTAGDIDFYGKNMSEMSRKDLARHRRHSVGMIFQSFNLIHSRTALENVVLPLVFSGMNKRERTSRGKDILDQVGLGDRMKHYPNELSGGEAQRVAIARALANQPDAILADEPTGNLDTKTSEEIVELLVSLNKEKGLTVIMVTHDVEMAEAVSDQVIRLKDGQII